MNGYNEYSSSWFEVSDSPEVLKWKTLGTDADDTNRTSNIACLEKNFLCDVTGYEIKHIPDNKKSPGRNTAWLIILKTKKGSHIAKRHNNNQYFKIVLGGKK